MFSLKDLTFHKHSGNHDIDNISFGAKILFAFLTIYTLCKHFRAINVQVRRAGNTIECHCT